MFPRIIQTKCNKNKLSQRVVNSAVLQAVKREADVVSGNNDYDGVPISVDD